MPLQRRHRLGLAGEKAGVLGDADHGEDFGEVRRQAERIDLLRGVCGLDQHLDHERDAARIDVIHFCKIQQNQLGRIFGQRLVGSQHRVLRGAGDIARKTQDADRVPGRGSNLVNVGLGFTLHDR